MTQDEYNYCKYNAFSSYANFISSSELPTGLGFPNIIVTIMLGFIVEGGILGLIVLYYFLLQMLKDK